MPPPMFLQVHMGMCWAGIPTGMGHVPCFHMTSAQKTQFMGEGNCSKNHLKKLWGRETIYLAGLEAVGATSANTPVCVPPIIAGWCTSGVVKGSRDRGRSVEVRVDGIEIETMLLFAPLAGTLHGLQPNAQHPKLQ